MDDRRGIPSDFFSSADVLRLFGSLFLNFENFHNFPVSVKNCVQSIHLSEMQTAFIDGHFMLSRSLDEGLCYRRSSDGLLVTINNIYFFTLIQLKRGGCLN